MNIYIDTICIIFDILLLSQHREYSFFVHSGIPLFSGIYWHDTWVAKHWRVVTNYKSCLGLGQGVKSTLKKEDWKIVQFCNTKSEINI